jgi:hypothetical protein
MSLALLALLPSLISAGIATATEIKSLFATTQGGMTDAELNAVVTLIVAKAATQQKIAQSDLLPNVGP